MNPSNRFWLWCGKNSWRWFLAMLIAVIVFALVIASLIGLSRQPPGLHSIGRIALLTPIIISLAILTFWGWVIYITFNDKKTKRRIYVLCVLLLFSLLSFLNLLYFVLDFVYYEKECTVQKVLDKYPASRTLSSRITLADNSRVHPNTFYSQIDEGRTYKICYLKNTRLVMELEEKYPLT